MDDGIVSFEIREFDVPNVFPCERKLRKILAISALGVKIAVETMHLKAFLHEQRHKYGSDIAVRSGYQYTHRFPLGLFKYLEIFQYSSRISTRERA